MRREIINYYFIDYCQNIQNLKNCHEYSSTPRIIQRWYNSSRCKTTIGLAITSVAAVKSEHWWKTNDNLMIIHEKGGNQQ